jgi:hypothetical protein
MKKDMSVAVTGQSVAGGDFDVGPARRIKPTADFESEDKKIFRMANVPAFSRTNAGNF